MRRTALMKCDARHEIGKEPLPHERFSTFSSYIPLHVARGQKIRLRVTPPSSPSFKSAHFALQEETPHVLCVPNPIGIYPPDISGKDWARIPSALGPPPPLRHVTGSRFLRGGTECAGREAVVDRAKNFPV